MAFENIVGNDKVKQILEEVIQSGNYLHSYLFEGETGIGKILFAKEFAKYILEYENDLQLDNNNHPDLSIIEPEGNSIKIEQIRLLQTKIIEKPIISKRKVYIIDECETMTKEAQNCLLKTLEEPPEYAIIILICSNENLLLSTIKSRCTKISFQKISNDEMKRFVETNELFKNISDSMLYAINGSIGKAYQIKEKQELYKQLEKILENIDAYDKIEFIKNAENLYKEKDSITDALEYINVILFKKAKADDRFLNCIQHVEKAKIKLKQNANYDMTIDDMLFHLWEEVNENYNRS
ncbi:MAG: DNA polymerase III subunit [Clostridia bacterium]|nr:DNA polymerase III subunit [Clostridia bacterium]